MTAWLQVRRGSAPLIVCFPHTGTEIPAAVGESLVSHWLARKDTDWWVDGLYGPLARDLDATTIRTSISRTVIDVNRDPSGVSLYPGQSTTELCPLTSFDGEPLYRPGLGPDAAEIASRRETYFAPYHATVAAEIERLRGAHGSVVLYDAHSIRSCIPRLFSGILPNFNIGTNGDTSCDPALTRKVERACEDPRLSSITNGRFRGGWTTRHYGQPQRGIHALQMELACRSYMDEPEGTLSPDTWPPPLEELRPDPVRTLLGKVLRACIDFTAVKERPEASGEHRSDFLKAP
jgi:N-formylglutamate deformylase